MNICKLFGAGFVQRSRSANRRLKDARGPATVAIIAANLFLAISPAPAANVLWHTNSSGLFDEGANWSSGAVPGSTDNAIFATISQNPGATYDVSFLGSFDPSTSNYLVDQWRMRFNHVNLKRTLSAASLTAGNPSTGPFDRGIIVGDVPDDISSVTSFLNMLTAGAASIAAGDRSTATLRLAGSNLNVIANNGFDTELLVGHNGNGTLDLLSNSSVTVSGFYGNATLGENAESLGTLLVGDASTFSAPMLDVGRAGSGVLNVSAGGDVITGSSALGTEATGHGAATIRGAGSSWSVSDLAIGSLGTGSLSIAEGGSVTSDFAILGQYGGSTGSASVHGAGSKWMIDGESLTVGERGNGSLTVSAGGQITAAGATIGSYGDGAAAVDGVGSELTLAGTLSVGTLGNSRGTLDVTGGGAVQSGTGHLGIAQSSSGTVTVGGGGGTSTWDIDGELILSESGSSFLHVLSGGRVTHGEALMSTLGGSAQITVEGAGAVLSGDAIDVIGTLSIAAGGNAFHARGSVDARSSLDAVTVDGAGSGWTVTELVVGGESQFGKLNITGGGQMTDSFAFIGDAAGSIGIVNVGAASTWTTAGDLTIGFSGAGTLNITGGGQVASGDGEVGVRFGSAGVVNVSGAGSAWTIDGELDLTGAGDSTLEFSLSAGTGNGLIAAGSAMLDGRLEVSLLDGFTPTVGNTFEIITASAGVTGTFSEELLPALTGGLLWNVVYGANSVTLEVAAPGIPGDYNGDGAVNAADYTVWRDTLGSTMDLVADGNGNNMVDVGDYDVWKANFGDSAGSGAAESPTTVPEPTADLLLLVGAIVAWLYSATNRSDREGGGPTPIQIC